jgi:TolB-like protein/Flp pilus assembly protein TadD
MTRDKLASFLWPDWPDDQAQHNLRQTLYAIRKALPDPVGKEVLRAVDGGLALNRELVETDVWNLEEKVDQGTRESLEYSVGLYRADLLEGFRAKSDIFDDWLEVERTRLREVACNALSRLIQIYADDDNPKPAIDLSQRLVALDPIREEAHRTLMQLYHRSGQRTAALKQYQTCEKILRREIDSAPEPETTELYMTIRRVAQPAGEKGIGPQAASEPLAIPDKPSFAVLPFENLTSNPDHDFFADGMTENIITGLGRLHWFFVIARNSTFTYKDSSASVKQIAQELGVRYVVEGSILNFDNTVRITARLVDATADHQIWAETYDREIGDFFTIQDEITQSIITSIEPRFVTAEARRTRFKDPASLQSWECVIRARWHLWNWKKEDCEKAHQLLRVALELDRDNAQALADLAAVNVINALYGWGGSPRQSLADAHEAARMAVAADSEDAWAHAMLGLVRAFLRDHDGAIRSLESALDLYPNFAMARGFLGYVLAFKGRAKQAFEELNMALRLSPRDRCIVLWYAAMGAAAFTEGDYETAIHWAKNSVQENPDWPSGHRILAASYGHLNRESEARTAVAEVLRLIPDQTIRNLADQSPFADAQVHKNWIEGMRKAGMPE